MKKLILSALLLCFTISNYAQNKKLKVVATCSMIQDMAKNIVGEDIEVLSIVPIGGDPHLYDPTPKDAILVAGADLILKNGLTFEGWLSDLIDNSGTKAKTITVTKGVNVIASLDYKNSADPHAWMNVNNTLTYIENIKNALIELKPDDKEVFEFNYGVYKSQLEELNTYIVNQINKIPADRRVLITSHDAFQYYGRQYGVELEAVLGTSTDADVQTSDMIRLNKIIKEKKIPAVFIESTINPKLLEGLAKSNNIVVGGELYADSLGDEESGANTYIDMLKHNTDVIVKALTRNASVAVADDGHDHEGKSKTGLLTWGLLGALMLGGFLFVMAKLNG